MYLLFHIKKRLCLLLPFCFPTSILSDFTLLYLKLTIVFPGAMLHNIILLPLLYTLILQICRVHLSIPSISKEWYAHEQSSCTNLTACAKVCILLLLFTDSLYLQNLQSYQKRLHYLCPWWYSQEQLTNIPAESIHHPLCGS